MARWRYISAMMYLRNACGGVCVISLRDLVVGRIIYGYYFGIRWKYWFSDNVKSFLYSLGMFVE